jgi:Arc/MetJ-type ribon-helix-helix transcriptional regulator
MPRILVPVRIPSRYRRAVSKQIAIRLPDEVVEFIDAEVRAQHVSSRAAFVQIALDRERRRLIAARDAELLARLPSDPDAFDGLASYAADLDTGLQ